MAVWSNIRLDELTSRRFDAEYYQPYNLELARRLARLNPRTIDDLAYVTDGIHGSPEWVEEGGIRYLSAKTVKDNYFALSRTGLISVEQHQSNPRTQARRDDVLLTTVGTIGNAAVVYDELLPANMDRHLGIIRLKANSPDDLDPYYVSTFLNSELGRFQTVREATGNVQLNLFIDKIRKVLIPVSPDLNQVGRLAREAYRLRLDGDALIDELQTAMEETLHLDRADLDRRSWYSAPASDIKDAARLDAEYFDPRYRNLIAHLERQGPCAPIGQWGPILRGRSTGGYQDEGIPVIRSGDLDDIDELDDVKFSEPSDRLFLLRPGDVCISSIGFGSIGKVQVFDLPGEYATVGEVTVIRQEIVNPYYLQAFLLSAAGQLQINRIITGATGQLHLYPRDVAGIVVPVIPAQDQEVFEARVKQARQARQQAKRILELAKRKVEGLVIAGEEEACHASTI